MSDTMTSGDLTMEVVARGSVTFIDHEPRGIPGHESNIAAVLGCSSNQTENLLRAVDTIEDDQHFSVDRTLLEEQSEGQPATYRVTITPA